MANLAEQKVRKELGQKIKFFRSERKMTQEKLSGEIGVTQKYLGHVEQGVRTPSLSFLIKIARKLNIELWELFKF